MSREDEAQDVPAKSPPTNIDAEKSVLGSILIKPAVFDDVVVGNLETDDFFMPAHREIFDAMKGISRSGNPIDVLSLAEALRTSGQMKRLEDGEMYLMGLSNTVPTAENVDYYVKLVKEKSVLRRLIATCTDTIARAYVETDVAGLITSHIGSLGRLDLADGDEPEMIADLMPGVMTILEEKEKTPQRFSVMTGIPAFDRKIKGLPVGGLVIVAGNPGKGKSSAAFGFAIRAAMYKTPNLFISQEMPKQQLVERGLGFMESIDTKDIHGGTMDFEQWKAVRRGARAFDDLPIYIYDKSVGIKRALAIAKRWRAKFPGQLCAVWIDYLQILRRESSRFQNEATALGEMTRESKEFAKEYACMVGMLSQLNRDNMKQETKKGRARRPKLSDLRGSGSIEQDADMVIFPWYEEEDYKDNDGAVKADLIVAKNRGGETGSIPCTWDRRYCRFDEDVEQAQEALPYLD